LLRIVDGEIFHHIVNWLFLV